VLRVALLKQAAELLSKSALCVSEFSLSSQFGVWGFGVLGVWGVGVLGKLGCQGIGPWHQFLASQLSSKSQVSGMFFFMLMMVLTDSEPSSTRSPSSLSNLQL